MSRLFCGIHHASLLVRDTQRALDFYHGVLGLEVDPSRPELSFPGAWLAIGENQQIHLLELPNPDPRPGQPVHGGRDRHIAMLVTDIERLRAALEHHEISYTRSRSGRAALFCRDPDGNALEFVKVRAE